MKIEFYILIITGKLAIKLIYLQLKKCQYVL
jgi:hypothetical protein